MICAPKAGPWQPLGDTGVHYWRVQRMAKTCGVDTALAARDGLLEQEDWVDVVQKCRSCQWSNECQRWLRRHERDATARPPSDCVNAEIFKMLSERQR